MLHYPYGAPHISKLSTLANNFKYFCTRGIRRNDFVIILVKYQIRYINLKSSLWSFSENAVIQTEGVLIKPIKPIKPIKAYIRKFYMGLRISLEEVVH